MMIIRLTKAIGEGHVEADPNGQDSRYHSWKSISHTLIDYLSKMVENGEQIQKICEEFHNNVQNDFQLWHEELNLTLMELKKGLVKNEAKSLVAKVEETNLVGKLLFEMEVFKFDVANLTTKTIEIYSNE
ncbi:hypothetical protein FNV43_RR11116 [Rhamnella rubrinervis]|uniref:Uncharacterized protein n=1 Tax=Rhamnella rubrinervis TaxID=2594499 RepID=A0A8K0MGY4_9ROSA|nr:hypothetical protein FNV43_RR11116 [Rhamnella rubrinervis]